MLGWGSDIRIRGAPIVLLKVGAAFLNFVQKTSEPWLLCSTWPLPRTLFWAHCLALCSEVMVFMGLFSRGFYGGRKLRRVPVITILLSKLVRASFVVAPVSEDLHSQKHSK